MWLLPVSLTTYLFYPSLLFCRCLCEFTADFEILHRRHSIISHVPLNDLPIKFVCHWQVCTRSNSESVHPVQTNLSRCLSYVPIHSMFCSLPSVIDIYTNFTVTYWAPILIKLDRTSSDVVNNRSKLYFSLIYCVSFPSIDKAINVTVFFLTGTRTSVHAKVLIKSILMMIKNISHTVEKIWSPEGGCSCDSHYWSSHD